MAHAVLPFPGPTSTPADRLAAAVRASERIAPTWPLDRFIAVNPFWPQIDRPLPEVAAELTALSGSRLLMPRAWYRARFDAGALRTSHLQQAIDRSGRELRVSRLVTLMKRPEPSVRRRAQVVDVADQQRDLVHEVAWRDFITTSISQHCAMVFDEGQSRFLPPGEGGLFARWRRLAGEDRSPSVLMGLQTYRSLVHALPETSEDLIVQALDALSVAPRDHETYLTSLLLDVNGWASWCAYRRWTARLDGSDDGTILELLAIRLAWEWVLLQAGDRQRAARWHHAMATWPAADEAAQESQVDDWLLQDAVEIAWQEEAILQLARAMAHPQELPVASVQAAFCIDVRSEVLRRALEGQDQGIQTLGFAGFFGMPIDYQPLGSASSRPQLPGLLSAPLRVTETGGPVDLEARRRDRLQVGKAWKGLKGDSVSTFAFVEAMGLGFAGRLVSDSLGWSRSTADAAGLSGREQRSLRPRLTHSADGSPVDDATRVDVAAGILRGLGLEHGLAPLVLLAGHASQTRNNPHAAGLDCGACCGQSGAVNARAAVDLLNDPVVRQGLAERGVNVPDTTRFVAGLHDTTTDDVTLFDTDDLPASHADALDTLRRWLDGAGRTARQERAPRLGLPGLSDKALHRSLRHRAADWAQVRPEWGLADNAAFLIAPRHRTRGLDLGGRAFLHDYDRAKDPDGTLLEQLMTAPMVVTHWINFQYYVSTVDPERYGSGNKTLHDVVGAHLGVFEGNGGDLRIGLPLQCVHDGQRWRHTPQRLTVFIDAPLEAVDRVVKKHDNVRQLIENDWLHVVLIEGNDLSRYRVPEA